MIIRPRPFVTKYDAGNKWFTKDCSSCPWYRKTPDSTELCGYGVAFNYLEHSRRDSHGCKVKGANHRPKERSIDYLDHFIQTRGLKHLGFDASNHPTPINDSERSANR